MILIDILKRILNIIFDLRKLKNDISKVAKKPSIILENPDTELLFLDAEQNEIDDEDEEIISDAHEIDDEDEEIISDAHEIDDEPEEDEEVKENLNSESQKDYDIISMNKMGFTLVDVLTVRSGPGTEYNPVCYLLKNTPIEIIGQDNKTKWYKIVHHNNEYGYVSYKYVAIMNFIDNSTEEKDDREYGDGCEELDNKIIDKNHACCFKFNKAVITQYYGNNKEGDVGAYGKLEYDQHCGAHNLPFGTLVYIPLLKGIVNPTGLFTVMDTGGHCTDFDIYTKKDIGAKINADVYVVSWGKGPIAWSFTEAINYYLNKGIVERYNTAWKLYNKMGGCTINFWKFKKDDKSIQSKIWYGVDKIKQV